MKNIINLSKALVVAILLFVGVSVTFGQWANPPLPAPGNNVTPLLNTGSDPQFKTGDLDITALLSADTFTSYGDTQLGYTAGSTVQVGSSGGNNTLTNYGDLDVFGQSHFYDHVTIEGGSDPELLVAGMTESELYFRGGNLVNSYVVLDAAKLCATQSGEIVLCYPDAGLQGVNITWDIDSEQCGNIVASFEANPVGGLPPNLSYSWERRGVYATPPVPAGSSAWVAVGNNSDTLSNQTFGRDNTTNDETFIYEVRVTVSDSSTGTSEVDVQSVPVGPRPDGFYDSNGNYIPCPQ